MDKADSILPDCTGIEKVPKLVREKRKSFQEISSKNPIKLSDLLETEKSFFSMNYNGVASNTIKNLDLSMKFSHVWNLDHNYIKYEGTLYFDKSKLYLGDIKLILNKEPIFLTSSFKKLPWNITKINQNFVGAMKKLFFLQFAILEGQDPNCDGFRVNHLIRREEEIMEKRKLSVEKRGEVGSCIHNPLETKERRGRDLEQLEEIVFWLYENDFDFKE